MSEWKDVQLKTLCSRFSSGININSSQIFQCGDYPVFGGNGKRGYCNIYNFEGECSIIGRQGAFCGNVRFYKGKCYLTEHAIACVANQNNDTHFLSYLLSTLKLGRFSGQSAQPGLSAKFLSNLVVKVPDLFTQQEIAGILSSLDAKIETNNKLNEKLEEMAQSIFKSWFVDFEPFKDQPFHETELGMIPEGWEVCYLGDFINEIETGKREKGGAINYGIPSIGAEKIERISYYDFSSEKYISWDFYNNLKKGKIKDCDVLLYKDGAYTGKSTMFIDNFPYKECAINEHVFILRTNKKRYQSFLYLFLNQKKIKELIHSLASSKAAQPGLNQKEISSVMFIKPSEDILNNFENMIFPLLKHIVHNLKENQRLASLRDTLLPRLMSGEIKV